MTSLRNIGGGIELTQLPLSNSTHAFAVAKLVVLVLLSSMPLLAQVPQRILEDDPGFDRTVIPNQFRPLKSRVAVQYHLADPGGAPKSDRIALAKAFTSLQSYEQRAVLGPELWPAARCHEFQPVLEAIFHLPESPEQDYGDTIADSIMQCLIDLGSETARKILLEDIRCGYPRLAYKGLSSLPEADIPELDDALHTCLKRKPNRDLPCDLSKIWLVIGRYGSAALLDDVKSIYMSSEGAWACDAQAAVLRYFIKHEPDFGLKRLEIALLSRGQTGKNNCFNDAIYDAVRGLKGTGIESFAIKQLKADHSMIGYSASKYLLESESKKGRKAVISMVLSLAPRLTKHNGQYFPEPRELVLNMLISRPSFTGQKLPSRDELDQLEANLSIVESESYRDEINKLRAVFE